MSEAKRRVVFVADSFPSDISELIRSVRNEGFSVFICYNLDCVEKLDCNFSKEIYAVVIINPDFNQVNYEIALKKLMRRSRKTTLYICAADFTLEYMRKVVLYGFHEYFALPLNGTIIKEAVMKNRTKLPLT